MSKASTKIIEKYSLLLNQIKAESASTDDMKVDQLATSLIPHDVEEETLVALKSTGNGNCLFNSISLLKIGNESAAPVLRVLTSVELYMNAASYVNHDVLVNAAKRIRRKPEFLFPDLLSIDNGQDDWYRYVTQMKRSRDNIFVFVFVSKVYFSQNIFLTASSLVSKYCSHINFVVLNCMTL